MPQQLVSLSTKAYTGRKMKKGRYWVVWRSGLWGGLKGWWMGERMVEVKCELKGELIN